MLHKALGVDRKTCYRWSKGLAEAVPRMARISLEKDEGCSDTLDLLLTRGLMPRSLARHAPDTGVTSRPPPPDSHHDALFRYAFSRTELAEGERRSVLPHAVLDALDFGTLRVEQGTLVDAEHAAPETDLLYRIDLSGHPAFVFILFEHQTHVSPFLRPPNLDFQADPERARRFDLRVGPRTKASRRRKAAISRPQEGLVHCLPGRGAGARGVGGGPGALD